MAGLLGDVLPAIYSFGNTARRRINGLLGDPVGYLQQTADQAANTIKEATSSDDIAQQFALRDRINSGDKQALAQYKQLDSKINKKMLETALNNNPMSVAQTAWHGSPYKFDKFSLDKIGTGEGAQAYGHGLYLAESPVVADSYKYSTSKPELSINGKRYVADAGGVMRDESGKVLSGVSKELEDAANALFGSKADKPLDVLAEEAESFMQSRRGMSSGRIAKAKEAILSGLVKPEPRGSLYKTDIPDEAVSRFLDWDKPLSQQADALSAIRNKATGMLREATSPMEASATTGDATMRILSRELGSPEAASKWLADSGIPGIRYLDGGSRSAGAGSSNFVVFDPEMIRILERNGQPTGLQPWNPGEYQGLLK